MINEVKQPCFNCESEGKETPTYDWRPVKLCQYQTTKEIDGIEIFCPVCKKTISVMPKSLFDVD